MTETSEEGTIAGLPAPIRGTEYGSSREKWSEQSRQGNIPESVKAVTGTVDLLGGPPGGGNVGAAGGEGALGGPMRPEQNRGNEDVRRRQEMDRLPVGAEYVINMVQSAEIGEDGDVTELSKAIRTALAYREGLTMGVSGAAYEFNPTNPRDRLKIANLQRMMTTVEGSISRSGTGVTYINAAMENALDGRILRAQEYHDNPDVWNANERRKIVEKNDLYKRVEREDLVVPEDQISEVVAEGARRFEDEYKAIPALVELRGDADSRAVFDELFIYRQRTCESPELASNMGNQEKLYVPTPDSPHWAALFGGEVTDDGKATSDVLEEMIKIGLPESVVRRVGMEPIPAEVRTQVPQSVYAKGFESAIGFGTWLNYLQQKSGGKMDAVWLAWKLGLTTEVIDTLGQTKDKKGKFVLATPPLGNALMTFLNHLEEKRMVEFGLNADGLRNTPEKFVGHSGLPMGIKHAPDLCSDYFHEGEMKFDKQGLTETLGADFLERFLLNLPRKKGETGGHGFETHLRNEDDVDYEKKYDKLREKIGKVMNGIEDEVELSLWDIWLYGRLGFADPKFPWYQTDQPSAEATPGELQLGSFGLWLLKRSRASKVLDDLKLVPELGGKDGLGNADFFSSRIRNWVKVWGKVSDDPKSENYKKPEDNPRAWWVMGLINLNLTKRKTEVIDKTLSSVFTRIEPEQDYKNVGMGKSLSSEATGSEDRGVSFQDVFYNAVNCGFLRKADVDWIKGKLFLKSKPWLP